MEIHVYPNPQYPLPEPDPTALTKESSCLVCGEMFIKSARCVWTVWRNDNHAQYSNLVGVVCDVCALYPGERYPDLLLRHADNLDSWVTSGSEYGERAVLIHDRAELLRQYAKENIVLIAHEEPCLVRGI